MKKDIDVTNWLLAILIMAVVLIGTALIAQEGKPITVEVKQPKADWVDPTVPLAERMGDISPASNRFLEEAERRRIIRTEIENALEDYDAKPE